MSAWPASSRITAVSAPVSARWVQEVWQHVRGATVLGEVGGLGMPGDDAGDVAGAQRSGCVGARHREQQVLGPGRRTALDPRDDRFQGVVVERDDAAAAALGVADRHPP